MQINDAFQRFLDTRGGRRRPRTRAIHTERLRGFLQRWGNLPVAELRRHHVDAWLDTLSQRGYAAATMTGYRESIKALVNFCLQRRWLIIDHDDESPIHRLPTGSKISRRRRLPSPESIAAVTGLARRWTLSDNPRHVRDAAIWLVARRCGPRAQELRTMRLSETRAALAAGPDSRGVFQIQSGGKTEETVIRITGEEADAIQRWLHLRPPAAIDRLFTPLRRSRTAADPETRWREMNRSSLDSIFVDICRAANVSPIRPHPLRHYVGTELARRGVGASVIGAILNHADAQRGAATAYAHYIQTNDDDISAAIAPAFPSSESAEIDRLFRVMR